MLATIARSRITIKRQATQAISQTAADTIAVTSQPLNEAVVQIAIVPYVAGTVTVIGTYDGSAQSEVLTIVGYNLTDEVSKGLATTIKLFDTVTSLDCSSGLGGNTTLTMSYRSEDGGAVQFRSTITTCYPAQISRGYEFWRNGRAGTDQTERITIMIPYTCSFAPRAGDIIINDDTAEQFLCVGAPLIDGGIGAMQHFRISADRRENY